MPLVIPIFIPHQGCPHDCIFCNQHRITGRGSEPLDLEWVDFEIHRWLDRTKPERDDVQVAFYGGSFTCLDQDYQALLLGTVAPFIEQGRVHSIRVSTRPDCITSGIAALLKKHGVALVELGVQSLDDEVLAASGRGHDTSSVEAAVKVLNSAGLQVGMQLMLGLPEERFSSIRKTVRRVIEMQPDCVRIYPVLVLRESGLERRYQAGQYRPLSLEKAVLLAAWMKKNFDEHNITVVRMGLQPSPDLEGALLAGPYHPAFGELVQSRLMFLQARKLLSLVPRGREVALFISNRDESVFRGLKSANMARMQRLGLDKKYTLHLAPKQERSTIVLKSLE